MIYDNIEIISQGYALAKTYKLNTKHDYKKHIDNPKLEIKRFLEAISIADSHLNEGNNHYYLVQKLMLNDPTLIKDVKELIEKEKLSSEAAIVKSIKEYQKSLLKSNSSYLQERTSDLEDLQSRLLNVLAGFKLDLPKEPFILVTDELMPSILLDNIKYIKGIITKRAGFFSHGAILARGLEIPYITTKEEIENDKLIVIDTRYHHFITEPNEDDIKHIEAYKKEKIAKLDKPNGYYLMANIFSYQEIKKVNQYGFDGVGLYRTEFIFINHNRPLTETEQYNIYLKATQELGNKPFCIRTFDIGDDKQLPYLVSHKKGFLNYVNNPELFEHQIRAILRANLYGQIKIMFPMIETKEEFIYLKAWVNNLKAELNIKTPVKIGMMLETKRALEHIEDFTDSDFFSIGTNDLSMELFKLDREKAKNLPSKYLIELQSKLKRVVEFCNKYNKELGVCGELAAIPYATTLFMDIGIKGFSISPQAFNDINHTIYDYVNKDSK